MMWEEPSFCFNATFSCQEDIDITFWLGGNRKNILIVTYIPMYVEKKKDYFSKISRQNALNAF